jgi:hypothetical protein
MKLNSTNKIVYKTNDHSLFNFPDNFIYRERFYDYLKESISHKNLLIDCPILVDKNFNIVDGCYRVLVAKSMGIELFYRFTENKRIDHVNIKDVRDKILADDYLLYYKDNVNYRILASEMNKFDKLIPKREFLILMGVNSKSKYEFGPFKKGEYIFEEKYEKKCKRLSILLNEYEWTKEPYQAIKTFHDGDFYEESALDNLTDLQKNYLDKYKFLLGQNKIKPQIYEFWENLWDLETYKPTSSSNVIKETFMHEGRELEYLVTFEVLLLIDKLYEKSDVLIVS